MQLLFEPIPKLIIGDKEYLGINIVEKLYELSKHDVVAQDFLKNVVNMHHNQSIPKLGFYLEDDRAVIPSKRAIDVGYDITAITIAKQLTPLTVMYETGISLNIPLGYYVEMIPRSSLSKSGYVFSNSIGVIDPSYTGTLKVALTKVDDDKEDLVLPARVAQIILKPYIFSTSYIADKKTKLITQRGTGGFGST
jgi:dUTP pyrophosphatase